MSAQGVWQFPICLLIVALSGARGEDAAPVARGDSHCSALVRQLGHEEFAVREQATAELLQIGLPALEALTYGAQDRDREIQYRSKRILRLVQKLDFERRLAGFAAGKKGPEYKLPGWDEFRDVFEDTLEMRGLFVGMQKAEPDVMEAVANGPQGVGNVLAMRCLEIQQNQRYAGRDVALENILALLFAAAGEQVTMDFQAESSLASLCYQPMVANAIKVADEADELTPGFVEGAALRKLLGIWVQQGTGWTAYQGLTLAMRYDLKEGLTPALEVVKNPGNQPYIRQHGVLAIAKFGDKSHEPILESLLDDETQCSSQKAGEKTYLTQIRDVALVALLVLRERDPKEFGFDRIVENTTTVFMTNSVGFENDEERKIVFDKWFELKAHEDNDESE